MKFNIELRGKGPSKEKHWEFAKQNLGNTGCTNICGTPLSEYYPGTSHLGFRSAETICLRIAKIAQIHIHFVEAVLGSDHQFLLALKKGLAKSVSLEEITVKFDEVGVLAFGERMPCILKETGFKGTLLEILCTFCTGLDKVYKNLLHTSHDLTGDEYEVQARIYLGFQAIFGTANLTASLKQIVTYVGYYVDKALSDAQIIGLPITLGNFKDGIMETAHKQNKKNSLLFSGGRNGPISKQQYQKQVIQQQFANEVFELASRESTPQKSSSTKVFSG